MSANEVAYVRRLETVNAALLEALEAILQESDMTGCETIAINALALAKVMA